MDIALWVAVIGGLFSVTVVLVTKHLESRGSRISSNTAVLAEIQRLLTVLERHKNWWDKAVKDGSTDVPLAPFTTPVFDEQVKTIGNVDKAIVGRVVALFGYVKFINAIQLSKAGYASVGKQNDFNKLYAAILETALNQYSAAFDAAFRKYGLKQD
jgi:rRNA processing protein Gar1